MADIYWEVEGTFVHNGVQERYFDSHKAPSAARAKDIANKRYLEETKMPHYKGHKFSKLTITKVSKR